MFGESKLRVPELCRVINGQNKLNANETNNVVRNCDFSPRVIVLPEEQATLAA